MAGRARSFGYLELTHTILYPQVTLNMLNASENEVDVEGLSNDVKLEFEANTEEVAT